jgi:hypothetical protein
VNICGFITCYNGGTCYNDIRRFSGFYCSCLKGFYGYTCEYSLPCACDVSGIEEYLQCEFGYLGTFCSECSSFIFVKCFFLNLLFKS